MIRSFVFCLLAIGALALLAGPSIASGAGLAALAADLWADHPAVLETASAILFVASGMTAAALAGRLLRLAFPAPQTGAPEPTSAA